VEDHVIVMKFLPKQLHYLVMMLIQLELLDFIILMKILVLIAMKEMKAVEMIAIVI